MIGHLISDGRDTVPVVSGTNVTVVYVGPVMPLGEELMLAYPDLVNYPLIELAPAAVTSTGTRSTPVYLLLPGLFTFDPNRIAPTICSKR